jgi:hypothetical protein
MSQDDRLRYEELAVLERMLVNARRHLLLIQERKTEFIESERIPLDLIQNERRWQAEIARLEHQIEQMKTAATFPSQPMSPTTPSQQGDLKPSKKSLQYWLVMGGGMLLLLYIGVSSILVIDALTGSSITENDASTSETPNSTVQPEPAPSEIATTGEAAGEAFIVVNTSSNGIFLRPEPSSENMPIETLPEGTRVEQIGADIVGNNFVWRHVRVPSGQEGWIAIDFLEPAP